MEQVIVLSGTWPVCPTCRRVVMGGGHQPAHPALIGLPVCAPTRCPAWSVVAQFDHASREWVSLEDLNALPEVTESET